MGYFRLHKSRGILPGIRINLSKSGPSLSLGPAGARLNIGPKGIRTTVGLPGSGLSSINRKSWLSLSDKSEPAISQSDVDAITPRTNLMKTTLLVILAAAVGFIVVAMAVNPG